MNDRREMTRRIALFVEGDTERGEARCKTLPKFFHNWLDPQLPNTGRIGIRAVKFQGVSNYLEDLGKKIELYLDEGRVNCVIGLVDLYGLPQDHIDLTRYADTKSKIRAARRVSAARTVLSPGRVMGSTTRPPPSEATILN